MIYYSKIPIPQLKLKLFIAKDHAGICEISFIVDEKKFLSALKKKYDIQPVYALSKLTNEINQVQQYFAGKRKSFDIPISLYGTDFQKKVWREISKIPYGHTISYSDLAERVKNKNALRAVGTACGKNPTPIVIPCHRVISKDGSIGGFGGGVSLKEKMLKIERDAV